MNKTPRIIWSIRDGKAGHISQISGLVQALHALEPIQEYPLDVPKGSSLGSWIGKSFPNPKNHPKPDLIIGAGHRTHLAVLAAKSTFGGHSVILMNPSLPKSLFDLCLIPEHDNVAAGKNIFLTRGAINTLQYQPNKDSSKKLLLIGGPSRYYHWDNNDMLTKLTALLKNESKGHWTVLTSRRTPTDFLSQLNTTEQPLNVLSPDQCSSEQYKSLLEQSETVWTTQDSISMIYEALTSGAAVGILDLKIKQVGRPVQAIQKLIVEKWVQSYADWINGTTLCPPPEQLNEATRCAQEIIQRWPNH